MPLSRKAKEAIKTALAMTIAYGIALSMDWDKPFWAGIAVAVISTASTQHQMYRACFGLASKQGSVQEAQRLGTREIQAKTRFGQFLDAAEADCYEVWELRSQWRRYQQQATELMQTMGHWRESYAEAQSLDLQQLLPNLAAFDAELDGRLVQTADML